MQVGADDFSIIFRLLSAYNQTGAIFLIYSLESLKHREVIDIHTGERLGFIDDAEINLETSQTVALIIYGRERFFGLFGKENNIIIPCSKIEVVGEDVILVSDTDNHNCEKYTKSRLKIFKNLFG